MRGTVINDCYSDLGNNQGSASGTCSNTNPDDDSILTLTVDLTNYIDATLSWYEWLDVFSYFDWTEDRINGTSASTYCPSSYVAPTAWVLQSIDSTPYVGGSVTIEWHFMASTVVNYAGWYIDDVLVDGTAVPVELQSITIEQTRAISVRAREEVRRQRTVRAVPSLSRFSPAGRFRIARPVTVPRGDLARATPPGLH